MARAKPPAEAAFEDTLAQAVTPTVKAAKFRRSGTTYHRRYGETVQVVNFQASGASAWDERVFYINAAIAFDSVCTLAGLPVLERPKEHECAARGMRGRLDGFIPSAPTSWTLRVGGPSAPLAASLDGFTKQLVGEFDRIDGLAAYRSHPWFDLHRPAPINAQVLYLLGDLAGAWQEVQGLTVRFAERKNANRAEWWIAHLRLAGLQSGDT
jgi:hypothetical protein